MTQQRWEALLDPGIGEMARLVDRYKSDGASFLDGAPKQLLPDFFYLGDREDVAVYGFFASGKFFVVNAPGGAGLDKFLEEQLQHLGQKPAKPTAVLLTSGDSQGMAGLPALLAKYHCQVVAPGAAWSVIKSTCPVGTSPVPVEDLPRMGWFKVEAIPLHGRGIAPVAYFIRCRDKSILCTGRGVPIKVTQTTWQELSQEYSRRDLNIRQYRASLVQLRDLSPDLWLPAVPCEGQNANLYEGDWKEIVADNLNMVR